jgi:putative ABC transport system permease protein
VITRLPASLPRADDVVVDWRVVLVTLAVAVGAGVVFGGVTMLHTDGGSPVDAARGGSRATAGRARRVGRRLLVAAEVALSLVLLVGAGLLVRSYARLESVSPGFDPAGTMTASVLLPVGGSFDPQRDGPRWAAFFAEYERRLAALPGVEAAGGISSLPLTGAMESAGFVIEGRPLAPGEQNPSANYQVVTPGFFRAARVPLLAGRGFDSGDRLEGEGVLVVSEAFARKYWPGEPRAGVLGRRINIGFRGGAAHRIVGIVGDMRQAGLDTPATPAMYLPQTQYPYPSLTVLVRVKEGAGSPAAALPGMRRELRAMNPALALDKVRPLQDVVDASISRQRFGMLVTGGFAAAALLLAMVGLYGVIAYGVAQRTRELGVRMALGATRRDVLTTVVGEGMAVTAVGLVVGVGGALAAARLLRSQLYDVSTTDVTIYAAVVAATAVVAFVASAIPARRATRTDPVKALRVE